jgi:feruloyl-CoA synthase
MAQGTVAQGTVAQETVAQDTVAQATTTGAKERRPYRKVRFGPPDVVVERKPDGTIYVRSAHPLGDYPSSITKKLDHWAAKAPDRILFAERDAHGEWRRLTYAQALASARSVGQALLDAGLSPDRPLVILSGNDMEHALLALAALYVGVPYAPVSPAYSLVATDFGKLAYIIHLLTPGLVFAADGNAFGRAIEQVVPADVPVVVTRNPLTNRRTRHFSELAERVPTGAVDAAHAKIKPDAIAKFLFTSGSTGQPKAVINTQRMLSCNQEMIRSSLAFFRDIPPVIVDWAPWHHTAGGNHNFGLVLYNGGSLYIDTGKPTPKGIDETVRNLREVSPTWYFNVPKGYEALLPYLRRDKALRETFFRHLNVMFYAGAGLAQHVLEEFEELAFQTVGQEILVLTSLGSTETAPFAMVRTWASDQANNIGVPAPGVDLKLAPVEGKLEARVRGPSIMPGYWRQPDLTAQAFDEEGYYRLGDALKFADPDDPAQGLLFDGRIAEDFKLATGTWVNVGTLRAKFTDHCAPYVRDVVVAGTNQNEIGVLIIPDTDSCLALCPDLPAHASTSRVLADDRVCRHYKSLLDSFARRSTGSSNRIARAMFLEDALSLEAGEVTDKGSVNQRAVLQNRPELVEELYSDPPSPRVMIAEK